MVKIEAELWALDNEIRKRGQNLANWTVFNVMQFASAYGYASLYLHLNVNPGDIERLLPLVRLANMTMADMREAMPNEKKSLKRGELYKKVRERWVTLSSGN